MAPEKNPSEATVGVDSVTTVETPVASEGCKQCMAHPVRGTKQSRVPAIHGIECIEEPFLPHRTGISSVTNKV